MSVKHLNSNEFEAEVLKADGKVLVDFWAEWCGPCKMLGPVIEEIGEEQDKVKVAKLNIDEGMEIAQKYSVMSIPTLILFENGEEIDRSVGALSKQDIINRYINA